MSEFMWDRDNPLARNPGETRKANDALQSYWHMGPGRSIRKLLQKYNEPDTESPPTRHFATLAKWSARYAWQARIDRAKEIEDEETRKRWQERRESWREEEYKIARQLLERAVQMLTFPVAEIVNERPDGKVQIVKPAKWKPADIARYSEVASKLARLAAEMETDKQRVVYQLEKELEELLNIARAVLEEDDYIRLLTAISKGSTETT